MYHLGCRGKFLSNVFVLFISQDFKLIHFPCIACSLWITRWTQQGKKWCQNQQSKSFFSPCAIYHKTRWDYSICICKTNTYSSFICEHADVYSGFHNIHHVNPKQCSAQNPIPNKVFATIAYIATGAWKMNTLNVNSFIHYHCCL
jgi:hypothetical protein